MDARIEKHDALTLVGYSRAGSLDGPAWVPAFWEEFFAQKLHEKLWNLLDRIAPTGSFSPLTGVDMAAKQYTYWIAVAYPDDAAVPEGMGRTTLTPGTFAVHTVAGNPTAIQAGWDELHTWLQTSAYGYVPDGQCFEYYPDGGESCEIWLQVQPKV
ncbi:MAG: GyrI-like domain-containing protein [Anaerolineae bacterium]